MQERLQTEGPIDKEQALSVSEITRRIKDVLEGSFNAVWIRGELSNIRIPPSGHVYASLKDADAQIRIVMFRGSAGKVANGSTPFSWKDGTEVLALGRVSVYGPQGSYQVILSHIEEVGSGALQAQFEALKKKLQALGWFEAAHKKSLPFLPTRVGIVTSPSGAAVRDILNVISRRFPNMAVDVYPAVVQGKEAPEAIIAAIHLAEKLARVDVLIVGRGGGSIEDLWCFNDEALAKTIFECKIPIVSAVGHEIDFTICDFVADLRAPTPSAAAEIVVPDVDQLTNQLRELLSVLSHHMQQIINFAKQKLDTLFHQLEHPKNKLEIQKQRLERHLENLVSLFSHRIREDRQALTRYLETLTTLFPQFIQQKKLYTQKLESALLAMDPKSVLSRGYALVTQRQTGDVISSSKKVKMKDKLRISFTDGPIDVAVEDIPLI